MTDWSPIGSHRDLSTLQRSSDARVAGVCGGLGARFGIDPNIIRVAFVVLALAGGAGFLAYLGAWIVLPMAGRQAGQRSNRSMVAGGALLAVAGLMALVTVGGVEPVGTAIFGLLFAGIVILNRRPAVAQGQTFGAPGTAGLDTPPPPSDSVPLGFSPMGFAAVDTPADPHDLSAFDPPAPSPPPTPQSSPPPSEPPAPEQASAPEDVSAPEEASADATTEFNELIGSNVADPDPPNPDLADPDLDDTDIFGSDLADPELDGWLNPIPPDPMEANSRPGISLDDSMPRTHWAVTKTAAETSLTTAEARPAAGPPLASICLAATLAILGGALVLNTVAGIYVGATTVVGAALGVVGLMIAASSFGGRTSTLIPLALILLLLLPASPIIDQIIRNGTGSSYVTVAGVDDLASSYRLGVGELNLDLSRLEIDEDTAVEVELGTGSLEIWLPAETALAVRAENRIGYLSVLGRERAGIGNELGVRTPAGDEDPVLFLDVSGEIGSIDIYQQPVEVVEDVPSQGPEPLPDIPGPVPDFEPVPESESVPDFEPVPEPESEVIDG